MSTKKRIITHNTLKKDMPEVDISERPFLSFSWNNEDGELTFTQFVDYMSYKYSDDWTISPEENSNSEVARLEIITLLDAVSGGPVKDAIEKLFKCLKLINDDD